MIGRAKTKTNHISREGPKLKTSKYFAGKKGSHIAMRHLGNKTRNDRNLISHPPMVWQGRCKLITSGYKEPTNRVFTMSQPRRAQRLLTEMTFGFPMDAVLKNVTYSAIYLSVILILELCAVKTTPVN